MTNRTRTRTFLYSQGTAHDLSNNYPDRTMTSFRYDDCGDVVGNYGGSNPFVLTHRINAIGTVGGRSKSKPSLGDWTYNNFGFGTWSTIRYVAATQPWPSDNSALSEALAKSNPSNPEVDLPVFLFELGDIPRMIKDWGRVLLDTRSLVVSRSVDLRQVPRFVGSRYLEYQFGVMPFISDVARMLNFQRSVDKKLRALRNLQHGPSSRTATVFKDESLETAFSSWFPIAGTPFEPGLYRYKYATERKSWVSTVWAATSPLPSTPEDQYWLAVRAAYGLDISLSTLWEAMPWSWLIDWFTNVGDLFSANRNTIPVSHEGSCLMRYARTYVSTLEKSSTSCSLVKFPYLNEYKYRIPLPAVALPEFNLPFLTGDQLSILSALAVTRR